MSASHPAGVAPPPPPPRRFHPLRWFGRLIVSLSLGVLLLIGLSLAGLTGFFSLGSDDTLHEQYHSLSRTATDKIAVITLEGAILDGDGFVKRQIDHVRDDESVKAVVLRVNSPGGTVNGSDYLYYHLKKMVADRKLPLVVSMGGIAASGGYYVSMAVGDEHDNVIFAEPTTWTGSIGVIIPHYDVSGLMERLQISEDSIKSHRLKQMGTPTRPMTEEEREIFQGLVTDSFGRFKEIVKAGRPRFKNDDAALDKVATGQVFTTHQALASGLVDKEGFVEDAIDRAIELAHLKKEDVRAVKYKHLGGVFDLLDIHARSRASNAGEMSAVLQFFDMATPRAYYLCTWLPALSAKSEHLGR
ncbi:MAG TPA: signal peptide peptidase SppA [Pirellulales bacterium]|nr:signal peptide peptidase SppA [Pirellulales bacterium]